MPTPTCPQGHPVLAAALARLLRATDRLCGASREVEDARQQVDRLLTAAPRPEAATGREGDRA
jgi:hypothetical protein